MKNNYLELFKAAIDLTKRHKIKIDVDYIDVSENYLNSENYILIERKLIELFPDFSLGSLACQCHIASYTMKPIIESLLNTEVYLTIGSLKINNDYIFEFNEDLTEDFLSNKLDFSKQNIPFHVWLTLPNLDIIDFTYGHSLKYKKAISNVPLDTFLFNNSNNLKGGVVYEPKLIGENSLRKMRLLID